MAAVGCGRLLRWAKLFLRRRVVQRRLTASLDWRGHKVGAAAGWLRPRTLAGAAGGWLRAAGGWLSVAGGSDDPGVGSCCGRPSAPKRCVYH